MAISKKRKGAGTPVYSSYLHKVLKQVAAPGTTISSKAMELANSLIEDLEDRIARKAFEICKLDKKSTLSAKHIQTCIQMLLPGDLAGHATNEGAKAVSSYSSAVEEDARARYSARA